MKTPGPWRITSSSGKSYFIVTRYIQADDPFAGSQYLQAGGKIGDSPGRYRTHDAATTAINLAVAAGRGTKE